MTAGPVLNLVNIYKHFGGVEALCRVNVSLESGTALGLMGDNGAGKTTLLKTIAGNHQADGGEFFLDGQLVTLESPADARNRGIELVHQDLALCDNLSASANIFLAREVRKGVGPFKVLDHSGMERQAGKLLAELGSDAPPWKKVRQLSGGQRQAVAIARVLLAKARVVLFDEPTASISVKQVAQVLDLIKRLKDTGAAVILVSHRMPDVFSVCDRVVVLRRGTKVCDKPVSSSSPEEVTALITGALDAA